MTGADGFLGKEVIGILKKNNFDFVVLLHGDGQYAPEKLENILEPLFKGKDAVQGSRMINKFQDFQYTIYHAPNGRYNWHTDTGQKGTGMEHRLLSAVVQLVNPDDYEGGNVQLLDEAGESYIVPRQKGCIVLFDSRTQHRVNRVTKGVRKSIVGWTVGPRWK